MARRHLVDKQGILLRAFLPRLHRLHTVAHHLSNMARRQVPQAPLEVAEEEEAAILPLVNPVPAMGHRPLEEEDSEVQVDPSNMAHLVNPLQVPATVRLEVCHN